MGGPSAVNSDLRTLAFAVALVRGGQQDVLNWSNIWDASFVKDDVIPLACRKKRWNVVVFESQRVIELGLRGIVRLLGETPHEHHNLARHVAHVHRIMSSSKRLPFVAGAYALGGDCYGVYVSGNSLVVVKRIAGTHTQMSERHLGPSWAEHEHEIALQVDGSHLTVRLDGDIFVSLTDADVMGPFVHV